MTEFIRANKDGQFFVLPERKILSVSVAKNACTTLKWMLADLAGEDLSGVRAGLSTFTDDSHIVHSRRKWQRSTEPSSVDPQILEQIHPDNGWFVFSVLRDPRARFFSAWQDKLLLRNPFYTRRHAEPWFPRYPANRDDIIADFARFTEMLTEDPAHHLLVRDAHFRPQTELLARHAVTYSHLYQISELEQLRADVATHLASVDRPAQVTLRASNRTPLPVNGAVFADGVREMVESIYAADFAAFGDRWDFAKIASGREWSQRDIDDARQRAVANGRIGEVRDIAVARGRKITRLNRKLKKLNKALNKAQTPPPSIPRRAIRRLRRLAKQSRPPRKLQWQRTDR